MLFFTENIGNGDGGPFGSVITKDNHIIGRGHNRVLKNGDPTCHGDKSQLELENYHRGDCLELFKEYEKRKKLY